MSNTIRILLLEGNLRINCERAVAHGTLSSGDRYAKSLKFVCPDIEFDKFYAADTDCEPPSGENLSGYDGVVLGGSGLHAYDDDPAVTRQIEFIKTVFSAGVPMLGSCWGMQIATLAAGGQVKASPLGRETGIGRKIALSVEGQSHPFFTDKSAVFDSPSIHLDEVTTVPDGAIVLASNAHSRIQALSFKSGRSEFWGVQYHPEFDLFHMGRLAVMNSDLLLDGGFHLNLDDVHAHADMMETLHANPSRTDLAWKMGIDQDVLSDEYRTLEIKNWVERSVVPYKVSRT